MFFFARRSSASFDRVSACLILPLGLTLAYICWLGYKIYVVGGGIVMAILILIRPFVSTRFLNKGLHLSANRASLESTNGGYPSSSHVQGSLEPPRDFWWCLTSHGILRRISGDARPGIKTSDANVNDVICSSAYLALTEHLKRMSIQLERRWASTTLYCSSSESTLWWVKTPLSVC